MAGGDLLKCLYLELHPSRIAIKLLRHPFSDPGRGAQRGPGIQQQSACAAGENIVHGAGHFLPHGIDH